MNVRRSAAALAASAVLCVGAAPTALAAPSPAPVLPSGLYGKNDPTYDGVWRQSFALLAQHTVGLRPAEEAVAWLVGQQCAEGGFAAFRPDATAACDPKTMLDTNATAAAVQALKALGGQDAAVKKGVDWLKSVQNEDGGWAYAPGTPSDASSTSVVISALAVAGEKPADVKSKAGKSAYEGLLAFQLGCSAEPAADRGAFGYQPADGKLPANADATAAAALAALGKGAVVSAPSADTPAVALACPAGSADPAAAAQGAAGYLAEALKKDGHLTALTPGADQPTPDTGNTADAVIALAAALPQAVRGERPGVAQGQLRGVVQGQPGRARLPGPDRARDGHRPEGLRRHRPGRGPERDGPGAAGDRRDGAGREEGQEEGREGRGLRRRQGLVDRRSGRRGRRGHRHHAERPPEEEPALMQPADPSGPGVRDPAHPGRGRPGARVELPLLVVLGRLGRPVGVRLARPVDGPPRRRLGLGLPLRGEQGRRGRGGSAARGGGLRGGLRRHPGGRGQEAGGRRRRLRPPGGRPVR